MTLCIFISPFSNAQVLRKQYAAFPIARLNKIVSIEMFGHRAVRYLTHYTNLPSAETHVRVKGASPVASHVSSAPLELENSTQNNGSAENRGPE